MASTFCLTEVREGGQILGAVNARSDYEAKSKIERRLNRSLRNPSFRIVPKKEVQS